jgi:lysophospholipase L1-like esterase
MSRILALGDSFTFGAELSDLPTGPVGIFGNDYYDRETDRAVRLEPSRLAWPALLAQQLGADLDNRAIVGGSNSRIFRRAISQTAQNQYSLVVCAWTQLARLDISWQDRECPVTAANPVWPWVKNYFADHYTELQEQERLLTQMIALQSYFKQRNQPYLYIKAIKCQFAPELDYLHNLLDQSNCVAWSSSMIEMTRHLPIGPDGHFLESGHELVADTIYQHYRANL